MHLTEFQGEAPTPWSAVARRLLRNPGKSAKSQAKRTTPGTFRQRIAEMLVDRHQAARRALAGATNKRQAITEVAEATSEATDILTELLNAVDMKSVHANSADLAASYNVQQKYRAVFAAQVDQILASDLTRDAMIDAVAKAFDAYLAGVNAKVKEESHKPAATTGIVCESAGDFARAIAGTHRRNTSGRPAASASATPLPASASDFAARLRS